MTTVFDWTDYCALDEHTRLGSPRPLAPQGLCAFEITLPPFLAPVLSAALPADGVGRVLFVATWEIVYVHKDQRGPRAWPTVPLLVWAGHGVVRLLYQCTAEEAIFVGQRLALLSHQHLQAPRVSECGPAVLLDLMRRYVAADPGTRAMLGPDLEEQQVARLAPWTLSWGAACFEVPTMDGRKSARSAVLVVEPPGPTVLVPLSMYWEPTLVTPLLPLDFSLFYPVVVDSPIQALPMRRAPSVLELFLPLRADNWRGHLLRLREDVRERLQGGASYYPSPQRSFPELLRATGTQDGAGAAHPGPLRGGAVRPAQLFNLALQLGFVCEVPLDELQVSPSLEALQPAAG